MGYYKCRLCLEETYRYVEIFHESFPEMIQTLTGISMEAEDGLPTTSCLQCHQEVKSAMLTRYQIINSHKILLDELKFNVGRGCRTKEAADLKKEATDDCYDSIDNFSSDENDRIDLKSKTTDRNTNTYSNNAIGESKAINEFLNLDNSEAILKKKTFSKNNDLLGNFSAQNQRSDLIHSSSGVNSVSRKNEIKTEIILPLREEATEDNTDSKLNTQTKDLKEIKFRKKRSKRQNLKDRIEFKKKKSTDNAHSIKVQYDIKPEHQEFLKTVARKDRVACPDCGRVMFGMNMKNHLITHNYDPVICDICGKTSKNAQALQDHYNYYHKTTPDRFMCDKCGKGYRVRFMLERHEKKEHGTGEKDYECSICGKKFFEKLHMKNHINITHNKIKAYKCEHCGKDFGRRTQFVTHQLVHTKQNRYHCQVCGKGFKIKQTMQTHLKGVHGIEEEKTMFCKICQKGFSTPQGLRAHVNSRVHGLEKCEHCSEFITVEYKSVHLRDIHGINIETAYS